MYYIILLLLLITLYFFWRFFWFFRNPERNIPEGNNIVSAADGTVEYVKKVIGGNVPISIKNKKEITLEEITKYFPINLKDPYYIVGVFMHPTSIHVNRAPIAGTIKKMVYTRGVNLPMTLMWWRVLLNMEPYEFYSKHILSNERNTTFIAGVLPLIVVQISDIYIKKIEPWIKESDTVNKGQRIGIIKMGSQVDIIFPVQVNVEIIAKKGDKVKAGESILAIIK